jgi:hypothetical protein
MLILSYASIPERLENANNPASLQCQGSFSEGAPWHLQCERHDWTCLGNQHLPILCYNVLGTTFWSMVIGAQLPLEVSNEKSGEVMGILTFDLV